LCATAASIPSPKTPATRYSTNLTQWFAFDWDPSTIEDDTLIDKVTHDPLREYCEEAKQPVPFFKKLAREEMSPYLAEQIEWFNNLTRYKWGQDVEGKV